MVPIAIVVAMTLAVALTAALLGFMVGVWLGDGVVRVYGASGEEIADALTTPPSKAAAKKEAARWRDEGLLVDVISELFRQLKDEALRQAVREEINGISARHGRSSQGAAARPHDAA